MNSDEANGMESSQEESQSPAASRYLVHASLIVVLFVLVTVFAVRARREYRLQTGIRFAERASMLMDAGEYGQAVSSMRAALQLAPLQPEVQRRAAHVFSTLGNANAFIFWHNLFLLEPPRGDDVIAFADWCRRVGREELISDLLPDLDSPEVQLARALTTTNVFERVTVLDRLATNPLPSVRFEVALQGCVSTNLAWVRIGRARMLNLARERYEAAQFFLLTQPASETALAASSLDQMAPDSWLPGCKPMADFVLRQIPLPDAFRQQGLTNQGIATFLRRQGQSLLRPDWLRASRTNYPLFLLQAEQLAERGNWAELLSECALTNRVMLPEVRRALSALASDRQGRIDEAFRFQTEAIRIARGQPARLLNLLGFAQQNGSPDFHAALLREFCQLPGWREKASRLLFDLGKSVRQLPWMIEGAEYLARGDPKSPWYGAWIYGRCLLESDLSGITPPEGNAPDLVVARALLLARQGIIDASVEAIESIPDGYRNTHWQVTAAYVYRRAIQRSRAEELIRRLNLSECFDEELYLLGLTGSRTR